MKRRLWLTLIFLLVVYIHVFAQDEDHIQQIIRSGIQPVTVEDEILAPDFSTNDGWYAVDTERRFLGVDEGAYRIEHSTLNTPMRGLYHESYENTVIVVETTQLSEENANGYGVVCRADPEDEHSGYFFFISGEGNARIFTYDNFVLRDLAEWTAIPAINTGQATNELIVVCTNTYLALYVNGEVAAQANSDLYPTGQIGFTATTYVSGTPVNAAFSNLHVYASSGGATELTDAIPPVLQNYAGAWQGAIAELQTAGMIGSGGELIFSEDYAYMESYIGAFFYPLASNASDADLVFGGEVTLTLPNRGQTQCGFLSRLQLNEVENFASTDFSVLVRDYEAITIGTRYEDGYRERNIGIPLESGAPVHILYILQGNRATVYINGELVLADFNVFDVTGSHGILLRSEAAGGRCEGHHMWAYRAPVFVEGICEATASGDVNRRAGPGTNFSRAGILAGGTSLPVIGQAMGTDGFVWWRLEHSGWVREDVVTLSGDCQTIPLIESE